MNNERRKKIEGTIAVLTATREVLNEIQMEEQDYRDNMPSSLGDGSKGEKSQNAIDAIGYAIDQLDDAVSNLEEAKA
jgi:hypothetical protein